jgi:hypothetical protein
MTSFSKVIQPKTSCFVTIQPLNICSFNELDDNDKIDSSISLPGHIDINQKCFDSTHFRFGLTAYVNDLHASNQLLLNKQTISNYEYNLANLMNLKFDAISRGDLPAAMRLQLLINKLQ